MRGIDLLLVVLALLWLILIGLEFTAVNKPSGDWIASNVESGQDRYGNCYLYVRGWQWMELVSCDRIGKGG